MATNEKNLRKYLNGYRAVTSEVSWMMGLENAIRVGAESLKLPKSTINKAIGIGKKFYKKSDVSGLSRIGIAGACLYLACIIKRENISQEQAANALGITSPTLRKRYSEIISILDEDEMQEIGI